MSESNEKWIVQRNQLKFSYEALYRDVAAYFSLSPTAAWVLYTLMDADSELAQQDLGEKWNFPKQTVNSCIQNLSKDGYLTLSVIPGTRNRKLIHLTKQGRELVDRTTRLLAQAEERAASHLTEEEHNIFHFLQNSMMLSLRKQHPSVNKGGINYGG